MVSFVVDGVEVDTGRLPPTVAARITSLCEDLEGIRAAINQNSLQQEDLKRDIAERLKVLDGQAAGYRAAQETVNGLLMEILRTCVAYQGRPPVLFEESGSDDEAPDSEEDLDSDEEPDSDEELESSEEARSEEDERERVKVALSHEPQTATRIAYLTDLGTMRVVKYLKSLKRQGIATGGAGSPGWRLASEFAFIEPPRHE